MGDEVWRVRGDWITVQLLVDAEGGGKLLVDGVLVEGWRKLEKVNGGGC